MKKIAKFETVSIEQFSVAWQNTFNVTDTNYIKAIYEDIKLPERATKGSAGYDFYSPVEFTLPPQSTITIPTGVRVKMEEGWVLQCFPVSGLGFNFRLQLDNTVGIIDADYYDNEENEGHIMIKMTNNSHDGKNVILERGSAFAQGIFVEYGITYDDAQAE